MLGIFLVIQIFNKWWTAKIYKGILVCSISASDAAWSCQCDLMLLVLKLVLFNPSDLYQVLIWHNPNSALVGTSKNISVHACTFLAIFPSCFPQCSPSTFLSCNWFLFYFNGEMNFMYLFMFEWVVQIICKAAKINHFSVFIDAL